MADLKPRVIDGNGPLMGTYRLYGDGVEYEGEPDRFQFGLHPVLDWGFDNVPAFTFEPYDFMAEGDSITFIPLLPVGLRGVGPDGTEDLRFETILGRLWRDGKEAPEKRYDWTTGEVAASDAGGASTTIGPFPSMGINPFERAFQEEFAARAQWCAHGFAECNHAPVIAGVSEDATASPGEAVAIEATATDPDGDALLVTWHYDHLASTYAGSAPNLRAWEPAHLSTHVTVPTDATPGDRIVMTLEVQDVAERPLTRYAQVAITVR